MRYGKTVPGVTIDSYGKGLDWDCEEFENKTIILKNTHDIASLKYKVLIRAEYEGQDAEEVAETTLAAGNLIRIALNNWYARVIVHIKSSTAGSPASYQIDYGGFPYSAISELRLMATPKIG